MKPPAGPASLPPAGPSPSGLRIHVSQAAATAARSGHPWIFETSIRSLNRAGCLGELAVVYDPKDRFLGVGLFDPSSPLRIRMVHAGDPHPISNDFWRERWLASEVRRRPLQDQNTTGYRLVHGESDGWPGLVLDKYGSTLVLKCYTPAWGKWLRFLVPQALEIFHPDALVFRSSRNTDLSDSGWPDGFVAYGAVPEAGVVFRENGIIFQADVVRGQKTGFFLDQRENRNWMESVSSGAAVLNAFSFSGGFSLYAARGGATSITEIDLSAHALDSARKNRALNTSDPRIASCPVRQIKANAFEWFKHPPTQKYDLILLDPPSLAKKAADREAALRAYARLAESAARHLSEHGRIYAASCTAHVPADEFFAAVLGAASKAIGPTEVLGESHHPLDHPAKFPEANYLKGILLARR